MKIKIKNASVITNNDRDEVLHGAQIHIDDELIAFAGMQGDAPEFDAQREVDAAGKIVMPGFFNTHTHVPMTLFRCYADDLALHEWLHEKIFPAEDKLTDEMVYWASLAAMCEFAAAGVVGFNDMYSNCNAILDATKKSGIRMLLGRGIVSFTEEAADIRIKEALELHEEFHGVDRVLVCMSPHAQYTVNEKTLKRVAGLAQGQGMRVHAHVSETQKEHEDCIRETGKTPVELFQSLGLLDVPFIGAHCVWVTDHDIELLAKHNATVASCPRSNLKLASGIAPLKKFMNSGVNVALGTDSAASNNKLSIMSEMDYANLLQKGVTGDPQVIPAKQAIRLATLNGAQAMGFKSGKIEAGWNADLIMIDNGSVRFSPTYDIAASVVYAANESDICMTIVGGDIIYENGKCLFADVEEIRDRLESYAKTIKA
ncbi:amidohydrolase [Christensenellaceae bacterium OttesenSCG-928-K19]|nr:amidohydrolase [Christensenellaceae bacterium OttesenSCG-928-K19]